MAVQKSDGPIRMSPDDFQKTEDGITYGVKFKYATAYAETYCHIMEKIDGDWFLVEDIPHNPKSVESEIIKAGSPDAYAETVVRPAVKAWLANRKLQQPTPADKAAAIVGKWLTL